MEAQSGPPTMPLRTHLFSALNNCIANALKVVSPPPLCFPWPSAVRDGATPNASTPFVDVPLTVGRAVLFDHRVHHCLLPAMARRHILRFEVGGSASQQCAIHRVCSGLCVGVSVRACTLCVYLCPYHRHHRGAGVACAPIVWLVPVPHQRCTPLRKLLCDHPAFIVSSPSLCHPCVPDHVLGTRAVAGSSR